MAFLNLLQQILDVGDTPEQLLPDGADFTILLLINLFRLTQRLFTAEEGGQQVANGAILLRHRQSNLPPKSCHGYRRGSENIGAEPVASNFNRDIKHL